jgi:hypothetical protein
MSYLLPGLYRTKNGSLVEILKSYDSEDGKLFVGVVLESKDITSLTPWLWFESGNINGSNDPDAWKIIYEVTRELYQSDTSGNVYVEGHLFTRPGSEKFRKILRLFKGEEKNGDGENEKNSGARP